MTSENSGELLIERLSTRAPESVQERSVTNRLLGRVYRGHLFIIDAVKAFGAHVRPGLGGADVLTSLMGFS